MTNSELAIISAVDKSAGRAGGKLERWQRKLLDLSLSNNLLNYKLEHQSLFVELLCPDPGQLKERLSEGESFRLFAGPELWERTQPLAGLGPAADDKALKNMAMELAEKNVLLSPLAAAEMEHRLIHLYRAAWTSQEESGAPTLYLVLGFLAWKPSRHNRSCLAPLVLVPVSLERQTVAGGFALSLGDDEPRLNLVIGEMLRHDFDLGHLGRGLDGRDISSLWRELSEVLRQRPGWSLVPTVGLGLFSFAKYLLWKDLSENAGLLKRNDLIRHLMSPQTPWPASEAFDDPASFDDKLAPERCHLPLSADSSQLAAIVAAAEGRDFVLLGPPGTGKSQTIANIIAQALASGRTVLFVAEKTAALRMVSQRLERIGLGPFCLELYSHKAAKSHVFSQLEEAAAAGASPEAEKWQDLSRRLAEVRQRLNQYARELHTVYPNGLTPFLAMGEALNNPQCPAIALSWAETDQHQKEDYDKLRQAARQLGAQGLMARKLNETALSLIRHRDWSPLWEDRLIENARRLHAACVNLRQSAAKTTEISSLPLLKADALKLTPWLELIRLLPLAWGHDWSFLLAADSRRRLSELSRGLALLGKYDEAWKDLSLPYRPSVLNLKLDALAETWFSGQTSVGPGKWLKQNKVARALKKHSEVAGEPELPQDLLKLTELAQLHSQIEALEGLGARSGGLWAGFDTRLDELEVGLDFAARLNDCLSRLEMGPRLKPQVMGALSRLLGSDNELLAPGGPLVTAFNDWGEAVLAFWEAADGLGELAYSDYHLAGEKVAVVAAICAGLVKERPRLNLWCAWRRAEAQAQDLGLGRLAAAVLDGLVEPQDAEKALIVNYARWWVPRVLTELPALLSFAGAEQERLLAEFRQLDRQMGHLAGAAISARLRSGEPWEKSAPGEWKILQRELAKKRRRKSVRELLASVPSLLRQLTPCLLMSPLSIASYLEPGHAPFDLLIFDEASQIPVWDAAGALARAKRVVVVGDPRQLPPAGAGPRDEGDAADMEEDLESLLDECLALGLPAARLSWHYRSRQESLINFTNHRYYNGDLVTFPAPRTDDLAISCHQVDGSYERGGSETNPVEARAVVEAIVRQLQSDQCQRHGFSLGVVAFNRPQQRLIEDLLDAERRLDPELDKFFDPQRPEPVIIKNLENIQGDERDIMFFSVCFGPDITGRIAPDFGVLNKIGGERRLNVALTRARRALRLFCSLKPEDIDPALSGGQGVADFRRFLLWAQTGGQVGREEKAREESFDSPFEQAVAKALRQRGWRLRSQVGSGRHKVSLAVLHPLSPERFLAAIESDGLAYGQAATARDRDILREAVLKSLGWQLIRVWSTEWWINPEAAAARLHQRLTRLAKPA